MTQLARKIILISALALGMACHAQVPEVEASADASGIVSRLQSASAPVRVEMPAALAQRAVVEGDKAATEHSVDGEAGEAESSAGLEAEGEGSGVTHRNTADRRVGFRVQVFADNNVRTAKGQARQRERAIAEAFPAYSTYVTYDSPYWRLRVGDFAQTHEAERAAAEIRNAFPAYAKEVRVVRDRINVR